MTTPWFAKLGCMPPWYWYLAACLILPAVVTAGVAGQAFTAVPLGLAALLLAARGEQLRRAARRGRACALPVSRQT